MGLLVYLGGEQVEAFFKWTAWELKGLKPYDAFHIAFFVFAIVVITRVTDRLKNCSREVSNRILFGSGLFLFVFEIYKQLFYYYNISPDQYEWSILPFQICSTPMYLLLMLPFVKGKAFETVILDYVFAFGTFGGLATFLQPSGMIHDHLMLTLHSFIWHMVLMFVGIHILKSRNQEIRSFNNARRLFLVFAVIALGLNILVERTTGAYINMFFLGPQRSTVFGLSAIYDQIGWLGPLLIIVVLVPLAVGTASRQLLTVYNRRNPVIESEEKVFVEP